MAKLLLVDDEQQIREMIKKYAIHERYEVEEACNGEQAVELAQNNEYDIIVMDIMMPVMDGFTATEEIKKIRNVPIILLSARGEEYDKVHGFEHGVDDYVVKPFSPKELMMRIKAILNRVNPEEIVKLYEFKGLKINFTARTLSIQEERVDLSLKEYELLLYFIQNKNIALTREQILNRVWGYDFYGDDRTLDTHIKLLRKKLGEYASLITTLRGVGYRFEEKE